MNKNSLKSYLNGRYNLRGFFIIKPKILVTGAPLETNDGYATFIGRAYTEAILDAGGIPYVLPLFDISVLQQTTIDENWLTGIDGLLLTGGEDVNPLLYGENPHRKLGRVAPERDIIEMKIVEFALAKKMPILGICRGLQLINIACGGTLHQDIYSQTTGAIKHNQNAPRTHESHGVTITENSRLYNIFNKSYVYVNSYHHQAINKLATGYLVSAKADDGIIEAIEKKGNHFIIAVQWHPESMFKISTDQYSLFETFIQYCGQYMTNNHTNSKLNSTADDNIS